VSPASEPLSKLRLGYPSSNASPISPRVRTGYSLFADQSETRLSTALCICPAALALSRPPIPLLCVELLCRHKVNITRQTISTDATCLRALPPLSSLMELPLLRIYQRGWPQVAAWSLASPQQTCVPKLPAVTFRLDPPKPRQPPKIN
jgi:hypothetical protein